MKLDKDEKKIVDAIANGDITDILSFVKFMKYDQESIFNKSYVDEKYHKTYENIRYICETRGLIEHNKQDKIIECISDKASLCIPEIIFSSTCYTTTFNGVKYHFPYFSSVYITDKVKEMTKFIALWQYLKENALIVELPKSCTEEDVALFLKRTPDNDKCENPFGENTDRVFDYSELKVSFEYFFNGGYELDRENIENFAPYLVKKIIPAPALYIYIRKKYMTKEDLNNRRNFWIALAGVIIAFFTAIASIIVSVVDKGYHKELNQINESLQKIEASIPENQDNTDISDKLDGIIEAVKGLQENTENEKRD